MQELLMLITQLLSLGGQLLNRQSDDLKWNERILSLFYQTIRDKG